MCTGSSFKPLLVLSTYSAILGLFARPKLHGWLNPLLKLLVSIFEGIA